MGAGAKLGRIARPIAACLHSCFSITVDLSRGLREHDPIILHFACHGDESAWSLFEQDLAAQDLEKFIASWTASGKRLRVVIANACPTLGD